MPGNRIHQGAGTHLVDNSGLLQEILLNLGSLNGSLMIKVDVDVLPKSTGIVISDGFGISKG